MFELPALQNVEKVVVDENAITGEGKPLIIYADTARVVGSK
jgi:ATP-dependent Clp protease ATP-binding subunit ClpX